MYAQVDVTYQDDVFFDAINNPALLQDGYALWGGRLGFISASGDWEAALWGKNLTGEDYFSFGLDLAGDFGFYQMIAGAPRTYGIELTRSF